MRTSTTLDMQLTLNGHRAVAIHECGILIARDNDGDPDRFKLWYKDDKLLRPSIQADGSITAPASLLSDLRGDAVGVASGHILALWPAADADGDKAPAPTILTLETPRNLDCILGAGSVTGGMDMVWVLWASGTAAIVELDLEAKRARPVLTVCGVRAAATVRRGGDDLTCLGSAVAFLRDAADDENRDILELRNFEPFQKPIRIILPLSDTKRCTRMDVRGVGGDDGHNYDVAVARGTDLRVLRIRRGVHTTTTRCIPPHSSGIEASSVPPSSFGLHGFLQKVDERSIIPSGLVATWKGHCLRWNLVNLEVVVGEMVVGPPQLPQLPLPTRALARTRARAIAQTCAVAVSTRHHDASCIVGWVTAIPNHVRMTREIMDRVVDDAKSNQELHEDADEAVASASSSSLLTSIMARLGLA